MGRAPRRVRKVCEGLGFRFEGLDWAGLQGGYVKYGMYVCMYMYVCLYVWLFVGMSVGLSVAGLQGGYVKYVRVLGLELWVFSLGLRV